MRKIKKIDKQKELWKTDTKTLSGQKMIYGKEVDDEVKKLYNEYNLNEDVQDK